MLRFLLAPLNSHREPHRDGLRDGERSSVAQAPQHASTEGRGRDGADGVTGASCSAPGVSLTFPCSSSAHAFLK
eukprot:7897945-Pyramimonas_sp.AAC.1